MNNKQEYILDLDRGTIDICDISAETFNARKSNGCKIQGGYYEVDAWVTGDEYGEPNRFYAEYQHETENIKVTAWLDENDYFDGKSMKVHTIEQAN